MNELIEKVEQWATDRNLHTASPQGQALKVIEEFTEMAIAYESYDRKNDVIDGIGDTYVTLIILCKQTGLNFKELIEITSHQYSTNDFYLTDTTFIYPALNDLSTGVSKGIKEKIEKSIIDIVAVSNVIADIMDESPTDCLKVAYNEIKGRKGRMIDGVFVKESDLMSSSFSQIEELARQYALTLSENGEGDDESFGRLKKYADEVGVNVTIYNLSLTTAGDSIDDNETLLKSVRLTGKWGCAISVKGESK